MNSSLLVPLMLALIALIGGVVLQVTQHLLAGAPTRSAALRWISATLVAAAAVVATPDLIGMALAWTATSLALHQLLSLDRARVGAQVAAHKKFLLSRLADVAIWSGVLTLTTTFGTTSRPALLAAAAALAELPASAHVGVTLLAVGVLLRTAQLPFHGWLIQVMETPTPFSALLHAGVINLGVFVLITLAPLVSRVPAAQTLLVISGTITAVLGVLAMQTRANVKGTLAWSTVAQMGFVVLECGIGAYDLAFVHLIAHALYKAHAFLRAGSGIRTQRLTAPAPALGPLVGRLMVVGALMMLSVALTWGTVRESAHAPFTLVLLLSAILPSVVLLPVQRGLRANATIAATALGMPAVYALWHAVAGTIVPAAPVGLAVTMLPLLAIPAVAALSVFVVAHPAHALAQWLYPHASAGFHLDDVFTRLTFMVWPPRRAVQRPLVRAAALAPVIRRAA